jgi:hypothetical protein
MSDESRMFVFGNGDDMPEELREILKGLARKAALSQEAAHDAVAEQVRPSKAQFALGPGDLVSVFGTDTGDGDDVVIGVILDPDEYAEQFPDWEERIRNSYVLCRYKSMGITGEELGWFPRSKCIQLDRWQYDEHQRWLAQGYIDTEPPAWMLELTTETIRGLNEANDHFMPEPHCCEECGSSAVLLDVRITERHQYLMGSFPNGGSPHDDPNAMYSIAKFGEGEHKQAMLKCLACGHEVDTEERDRSLYLK